MQVIWMQGTLHSRLSMLSINGTGIMDRGDDGIGFVTSNYWLDTIYYVKTFSRSIQMRNAEKCDFILPSTCPDRTHFDWLLWL